MCWNPQGSGALDVIITLSAVSCKCFFVGGILKMVSVNGGSCVLKCCIYISNSSLVLVHFNCFTFLWTSTCLYFIFVLDLISSYNLLCQQVAASEYFVQPIRSKHWFIQELNIWSSIWVSHWVNQFVIYSGAKHHYFVLLEDNKKVWF